MVLEMSSSRIPCACLQVILHRQASGRHWVSSVASGEICWNNVVWDFCPATVTAAKQRPVLPVEEREPEPHGSALPSRGTGLPAPKARPTISLRLLSGRNSGFLTLDSHKNSSAVAEMCLCMLGTTSLKIWTISETFSKMYCLKLFLAATFYRDEEETISTKLWIPSCF